MADVTISELNAGTPNSSAVVPYSDGTTTLKATVGQIGVPIGTIVMWSNRGGASIPTNWALCDGTNGTPDLRGRFIVGSGQGTGLSNYNVGDTGGSESVTLTTTQIPSHNHLQSFWIDTADYSSSIEYITSKNGIGVTRTAQGTYTNIGGNGNNRGGYKTFSHTAGGGGSHENRPPYYALAYIQKIS